MRLSIASDELGGTRNRTSAREHQVISPADFGRTAAPARLESRAKRRNYARDLRGVRSGSRSAVLAARALRVVTFLRSAFIEAVRDDAARREDASVWRLAKSFLYPKRRACRVVSARSASRCARDVARDERVVWRDEPEGTRFSSSPLRARCRCRAKRGRVSRSCARRSIDRITFSSPTPRRLVVFRFRDGGTRGRPLALGGGFDRKATHPGRPCDRATARPPDPAAAEAQKRHGGRVRQSLGLPFELHPCSRIRWIRARLRCECRCFGSSSTASGPGRTRRGPR